MKIHSLAKALRTLANVFETCPNIEVKDLGSILGQSSETYSKQVALNLKTLHSLSKISKKEWVKLIQGYGFSIDLKPRDSSRDVIGKILNYLDSNPEAVDILKKKGNVPSEGPSALSQALDILLEDLDYEKS